MTKSIIDTKDADFSNDTVSFFICKRKNLTSLKGAPKEVKKTFICSENKLKTLKYSPKNVGEHFVCLANELTTLKGCPKNVGSDFDCDYNNLISLKYAPESVGGDFNCAYNEITSLAGFKTKINGSFYAYGNPNPHLEEEYEIRKNNPDLDDKEINAIMYEKTKSEFYLPKEAKDIFFF